MPDATIQNPAGAYGVPADYRTTPPPYVQTQMTLRANGTISANDLVSVIAATATVPLSVARMGASDAAGIVLGVALAAAKAGGYVQVAIAPSIALTLVEAAATPVFGDYAVVGGTTAGAAGVLAAGSIATTTIAGTILGTYVGVKIGSTNTALILLGKV